MYSAGYSFGTSTLLPHTNLQLNLPLLQHQPLQNFSVKDQHLLKPPPAMGAAGGFGRRASDGGANLQTFYQKNIEQSDWNNGQQQQQPQQFPQNMTSSDPMQQRSNPLVFNDQPSTSHHSTPGSQSTEALDETQNSYDVERYVVCIASLITISNILVV